MGVHPAVWLVVALVAVGCSDSSTSFAPSGSGVALDFTAGTQGWTFGFADYPAGEEGFYELVADYRALPLTSQADAARSSCLATITATTCSCS